MSESELRIVAFPTLTEAQMNGLERCPSAGRRRAHDGEVLVEEGQGDGMFYVVKSGSVEIVDSSDEEPKTVVVHGPGQFTGEVSQLTGSPALVSAVARSETELYEISPDSLHKILSDVPELGDVILQAFLARRQLLRESGEFVGPRVFGSRYSRDTFRIREFLAQNRVPFTWLDVEDDAHVQEVLARFGLKKDDTPVVSLRRDVLLRNPTNRELAAALGLWRPIEKEVYDLVVVGAGPAGLAAAVYGASEGLRTLVLERTAPGGQAGRSMRIENYLGFPTGITGGELAERAVAQAHKFGARLPVASQVDRLRFEGGYPVLELEGGEEANCRCLLVATGAEYRLLGVEGCEEFEGRGVYYAATPNEAQMCSARDVVVVGGGNSAGQAAVYLSRFASRVHLVVRGGDLYEKMSYYLAHRIEQTPGIELMLRTVVKRMLGDGHLSTVELESRDGGAVRAIDVAALFSFIGAIPRTNWLPEDVERDEKQYVLTGPQLYGRPSWKPRRPPFFLETSHPGVFAAGDVRSGSIKRVASAVGEGSMAVQLVHQYLALV